MKRKFTTILTLVLILNVAACSGDDAGGETENGIKVVSEGKLTVCTDAPYEPFEYPDPSSETGYTGFDIDVVNEIALGLDLKTEIRDLGFDGLQSGASLAAGQCDLVASAMTITEERKANLDFSDAYYDSKQSLLAPVETATTLADLDGKKLGVQQGTTGATYAKDSVSGDVELVEFPSDAELYAALTSGSVQGVLQDLPVNLAHTEDGAYEIVEEYATNEQYGFAVKKDGADTLLAEINRVLDELRSSGRYDEIYESYFSK